MANGMQPLPGRNSESGPFAVPIRILLIEDSTVDACALEGTLRRFAFTVEHVSSLSAAATILRSSAFDLILSDLGLPDSSGLETLDALLDDAGAIPIVVITGRDDEATALRAVAAGAQDYLFKGSTDPNALVRAVRYAVERGKATEGLIRSEARMRTILEGALDAVIGVRIDGRITRWNRTAEEIFGWSRAEVLGRPVHEVIVPDRDRPQHEQELAWFRETGSFPMLGRRVEWLALRRDGSEFPAEVRITAEADEEGATFTVFLADITERRRAEEERRAADAKFRALVEYASDGILTMDEERRCLYASPAISRMFGYSSAEMVGCDLFELIHPDDMEYVRQRFVSPHAQSPVPVVAEFRVRHRDGSWRYVEVLRANHLADPHVRAIVANVRDVTARRQAQQALDQLRRQSELILNSISDGVHGIDLEGNFIFENPAAAEMLGWLPTKLIGRPAHATIHHCRADGTALPEHECPMHWTLADGVVRGCPDDVFWRKDGTPVRVEYAAAPMRDEQGRIAGMVVTFRDITRQRQMEQQVEQASRVASLGRVSASVAHEFNNLLMGMAPFAQVLEHRSRGDESLTKLARHILNVVRRGQRLTDEILQFTRPPELHLQTLELSSWLPALCEEARGLVGPRRLVTELAEDLTIRADGDRLSQVLLNLVKNACDATPTNGTVTLGAARADTVPFLRPQLPTGERLVTLFVRDDGSGIPPELVERIFEPLFTTRKAGHGIGLALASQIVAQHSGQILIDTAAGAGSTFHLVLPGE